MRRSLRRLAAISVLLFLPALWPQPSPQRVTSQSVGQAVDWTPVASAVDAQAWWYASIPPPTTTTTPARRIAPARHGTVTAAVVDGDRFDRLATCESGMRQDAVDPTGSFLSFFQWRLSTFHAAGGVGDPRDVDYDTQKSLAVSWAQQANPFTQWPVCWPRTA